MNNDRGFNTAQRRYDNAEPRDGGVEECDECKGRGWVVTASYPDGDSHGECDECSGTREVKL